ncbi:MAG: class I SAM-dependent methyltransferase [Ramlibacter sp.]|nr:class I SAM-dependent methyltransferase [Ramlibacter sp.]
MDNSTIAAAKVFRCSVCSAPQERVFQATILRKYEISYLYCAGCGFLCTEPPFWLDEAYSTAIASTDTGLVTRNIQIARVLSSLLYLAFGDRGTGRWLDYAGGYGMLTRLMRDKGYDFYWADKHASNLFAQGFEHKTGAIYDGVTAFEVLEHTENPIDFLSQLLKLSRSRTIILTTEIYHGYPPTPDNWWYFGLNTGQHIAFFQERTLRFIAGKLQLRYVRSGSFHIFSEHLPRAFMIHLASSRLSIFVDSLSRRILQSRLLADHVRLANRLEMDLPSCLTPPGASKETDRNGL